MGHCSGFTIFVSAFLLFSVEPLVAKRILPWFGGSAAVWSTCLVFYQTALLIGYLYARWLTRYFEPRSAVRHSHPAAGRLAYFRCQLARASVGNPEPCKIPPGSFWAC